mgnify:CR=1 FL=1
MIFMQYKITTCLSIDGVLKKNKEIPTSNGEDEGHKPKRSKSPNFQIKMKIKGSSTLNTKELG